MLVSHGFLSIEFQNPFLKTYFFSNTTGFNSILHPIFFPLKTSTKILSSLFALFCFSIFKTKKNFRFSSRKSQHKNLERFHR